MHKEIIKKKSCRYDILVSDQSKSIRGIYMTNSNCIIENRTFTHLTDIQRGKLEQMAKIGTYKQAEMARELGVSQSTVSRELKRGRTRQPTQLLRAVYCRLRRSGLQRKS